MAAASWVMASPARYEAAQRGGRAGRLLGRGGRIRRLPPPLSAWTSARDAPAPPAQTFRQWWRTEHGDTVHGDTGHRDTGHGSGEGGETR